jgi:hypothetical protein
MFKMLKESHNLGVSVCIFTAPFFFSSSLVVGWVLKLISGFWISAEMSSLSQSLNRLHSEKQE